MTIPVQTETPQIQRPGDPNYDPNSHLNNQEASSATIAQPQSTVPAQDEDIQSCRPEWGIRPGLARTQAMILRQ